MAKVSLRAYNRDIETMIDRGQLDEAIAHCNHILKTYPKHLETYRLLGKAYLEYKRHNDAVDVFTRVLVVVPNDFVAHVGMSIIRDEENRLDDAIWHMERAFETQPSNAAIQGELQRLYGRRDGIQPPRIRMTRGALAHMYVQGELFPQAISEIKSVLKEDGSRVDMQALLARACYRSGLKNEAAEVASSVLHTYPYCLDANRVLLEILGSDHVEGAQVYRQRVVELDPYAAHVTGTVFQSIEVPDAAVSLERLDWNGQPVGRQPDWRTTQAISLEKSPTQDEQPDWLKNVFDEQPAESDQDRSAAVPPFDTAAAPATSGEAKEDIPDFLRAAGWGDSSGEFDESKAVSAYDEPETEPPIAKGELPDWVKAMAPTEAEQPSDEEEDELPDWISKIGTGVSPVSSEAGEQPDWLKQLGQSEQPAPLASEEQPDWLQGLGDETESEPPAESTEPSDQTSEPAPSIPSETSASDQQPDWMQQAGESELATPPASEQEPDWLAGFGVESESAPATSDEELDWLAQLGEQAETPTSESALTESSSPARTEEQPGSAGSVSLDESSEETQQPVSSTAETDELGTTEQERDDSFAWLESLAAKQGASEGLLTNPEERLEEEPDWVKRAKGLSPEQTVEQPASASQPASDLEELGKSEQERDDSFAWLESLAARQGASEGLLTEPEERSEQEPDWVRKAKDLSEAAGQQPESTPAEQQPSSAADTAAWLRSLDDEEAFPPSSEADATGIWLKSLDEGPVQAQPEQLSEQPESEMPVSMQKDEAQPEASSGTPAVPPEEAMEESERLTVTEESMEIQSIQPAADSGKEVSADDVPVGVVQHETETAATDDMPEWMQYIEEKEVMEERTSAVPAKDSASTTPEGEKAAEPSEWAGSIDESLAPSAEMAEEQPRSDAEEIPAWLSSLDKEEGQATTPSMADQDLPAWLREEEQPAPAALELEPTRAADWQLTEETQPEEPPSATEVVPEIPSEPQKEPATPVDVALSEMPVDPILGQARDDLSGGDIPGALNTYGKLIKKTRLLDEVIHDLREALYRYPVDVSIWQSLGDAYMRANRLQDALDAYTKAEELLR